MQNKHSQKMLTKQSHFDNGMYLHCICICLSFRGQNLGPPWRRQIGQITGRPAQKTPDKRSFVRLPMNIIVCLYQTMLQYLFWYFSMVWQKRYEQKAKKEEGKGDFLVPGFWILDSGN